MCPPGRNITAGRGAELSESPVVQTWSPAASGRYPSAKASEIFEDDRTDGAEVATAVSVPAAVAFDPLAAVADPVAVEGSVADVVTGRVGTGHRLPQPLLTGPVRQEFDRSDKLHRPECTSRHSLKPTRFGSRFPSAPGGLDFHREVER